MLLKFVLDFVKFDCFDIAMCDCVHDVETIFAFVIANRIIALKALGRDCTYNNGLILQIGVLSS